MTFGKYATPLPKQKHDTLWGSLKLIVSLNFESEKALRFDSAINGIILAKLFTNLDFFEVGGPISLPQLPIFMQLGLSSQ